MNRHINMYKAVIATVTVVLINMTPVTVTVAAETTKMQMAPFSESLKDKLSLQRGARLFVNYCLSCHSAQFMRYNRMAEDLEIPPDIVKRNMMFVTDKIGEPMTVTMPKDKAAEWFGVAPPDLSLSGRLRGGEWLYNYLRGFYVDDDAVGGWNNAVFENVAMPHALYELQGMRRAVMETVTDDDGSEREIVARFEAITEGTLSEAEYDQAAYDLANFLVYVGEPAKTTRITYGIWTMLFLAVFAWLAWLLKKEYWRDVK